MVSYQSNMTNKDGLANEKMYVTFNGMQNCGILKDWYYRGEGNANVVISIPNTRQILRIKKTAKAKSYLEYCMETVMRYFQTDNIFIRKIVVKSLTHKFKEILRNILDWWLNILDIEHKQESYNDEISLRFYKQIMIPLLGKQYTSEATFINLSKKEITLIENEIDGVRPEFRKKKRLCYGKATLFVDYAFLPKQFEQTFKTSGASYAIEIKLKHGWVPICKQNDKKCQFCKNQYLKLKMNKIEKVSNYCPFDLFSGDLKRMQKAISSLIDNPQNNLKLFRDGKYVYGEMMSQNKFYSMLKQMFGSKDYTKRLHKEFSNLLIKALTTPLDNNGCDHNCTLIKNSGIKNACNRNFKEDECDYDNSNLPNECVLEKILTIQQFYQLNLKFYEEYYNSIPNRDEMEWKYLEIFLDHVETTKQCPKCVLRNYVNNSIAEYNENKLLNDSVLNILPYLVASVAADCSLIITFKKVELHDTTKTIDKSLVIGTSYGDFLINIGVVDLYPKPLSTIPKHVIRDSNLEKVCAQ